MDRETQEKIMQQIKDYENERDEFRKQAEQQLVFINGKIAALQVLLNGSGPVAEK